MAIRFSLLVFTLNEIDGMRAVMPKIRSDWVDEIIIVDGGSTDGTIDYAQEMGYQIYVQKQKGFRHAYCEILERIDTDYIIAFSPDGNSLPEKIPELIDRAKRGYDMVTCSRYLGEAKSYDDDVITAFGNWFFTKSINVLHGASYTDAMVMYRAVHTSVFSRLELDNDAAFEIPERLFKTKICLMPLLSIRAARAKLKTCELAGDEPARIGGERKLKIVRWGLAYYFQIIYDIFFKIEKRI